MSLEVALAGHPGFAEDILRTRYPDARLMDITNAFIIAQPLDVFDPIHIAHHIYLAADAMPVFVGIIACENILVQCSTLGRFMAEVVRCSELSSMIRTGREFESLCEQHGPGATERIRAALGANVDAGALWRHGNDLLHAGVFHLVALTTSITSVAEHWAAFLSRQGGASSLNVAELQLEDITDGRISCRLVGDTPETRSRRLVGASLAR